MITSSKLVFLGLIAATFAVLLTTPAMAQCVATESGSGTQCFPLLAGQTIEAGSVCVRVENNTLNVTYTTTGGWELSEAHLWIGNDIANLPQTRTGNPIPGQFPYKSGDINGLNTHTFAIPLSNTLVNFSCPADDTIYYMAAHASVRKVNLDGSYQTETGWSDGSPITSRGNWATFSTFTLTCDCGGSEEKTCETAFAQASTGSTCFLETTGLNANRWGWTNQITAPGTYTFTLWAGAGQCDTSKGANAGTVTVVFNGSSANVTYSTVSPWIMEETHLYVGSTILPLVKQGKTMVQTVAPGQYPYIHSTVDASSDSYTVPVTAPFYVIAHAVTCG